jgi:hypothetical protein
MTEQKLNGPQIGTGFEEMDGECVPQRTRGDRFGKAGQTMGLLARCFYRILRDRPIIATTREQPLDEQLSSGGAESPAARAKASRTDLCDLYLARRG